MVRTRAKAIESEVAPIHSRCRGCGRVKGQGRAKGPPTYGRAREPSPENVYEHEDEYEQQTEEQQTEELRPAKPPVVLDNALMLQELLVRLLARLDGAPTPCVIIGTSGSPIAVGTTQV
ncbi:uncharacterized protein LOC129875523 [Solanum dulcamara]|uniref:uncharacterized protein LOC129875523 n=1 Tax=Solanum dulcamara TaxID=45834 RepID=UPI002484E6CC|nr:uncharacterized protein LOC129875523 [Solanum dulcamara]